MSFSLTHSLTNLSNRLNGKKTPTPLIALVLFGSAALGQIGGTGSIQGTVTDSAGAVISGATVTAANSATNAITNQQSSS